MSDNRQSLADLGTLRQGPVGGRPIDTDANAANPNDAFEITHESKIKQSEQ